MQNAKLGFISELIQLLYLKSLSVSRADSSPRGRAFFLVNAILKASHFGRGGCCKAAGEGVLSYVLLVEI